MPSTQEFFANLSIGSNQSQSTTTKTPTQKHPSHLAKFFETLPPDIETLRQENLHHKQHPNFLTESQRENLFSRTNERRLHISQAITRMAAHPASPYHVAVTDFYFRWLEDTCDPLLAATHLQWDRQHQILLSTSNTNGSRKSYYELVGQTAALRYGMIRIMQMHREHHADTVAALENLKCEMATLAARKTEETENDENAAAQFNRCMNYANQRAERWNIKQIEKRIENEKQEQLAKKARKEKVAANKLKQSNVDSGFTATS